MLSQIISRTQIVAVKTNRQPIIQIKKHQHLSHQQYPQHLKPNKINQNQPQ